MLNAKGSLLGIQGTRKGHVSMKNGGSHMGCHDPKHLFNDIREMADRGIHDVLVAIPG